MIVPACLYCRESDKCFSTREHFVPERLGHGHPYVLDRGVVCDQCQGWASHKIDPALFRINTQLAATLHHYGIPAKCGRPTNIETDGISFDAQRPAMTITHPRRSVARQAKDELILSRAYHKLGLGTAAALLGIEAALDKRLDECVKYVRRGNMPYRPYVRVVGRWIDVDVALQLDVCRHDHEGTIVAVQLYDETIFVCLAGDLGMLRKLDLPGAVIVDRRLPDGFERLARPTTLVRPVPGTTTIYYGTWRVPPQALGLAPNCAQRFPPSWSVWRSDDGSAPRVVEPRGAPRCYFLGGQVGHDLQG